MSSDARRRVAIVATHPIQHFVPFYRALALAPDLDVHVFFASRIGLDEYFDSEMNINLKWEMDLLSGYKHTFLPGSGKIKSATFLEMNNISIWKYVKKFKPDAIIAYGYSNITTLWTIFGALLSRTPLLLISDSERVRARPTLAGWIKGHLLPLLAANISGALTVGDRNEAYWAHFGVPSAKLFRTPFTIDEPLYRATSQNRAALRHAWREAYGVGQDEVVFLAVGKLSKRKRQADILEALLVASEFGALRVVFAGDGDQRTALEETAAQAGLPVTFLGFVNLDALPQVYAAADVLVHPSSSDPHPLVFSEAACIGLPIIASDQIGAVGPTDIARKGENALVYPVGDIQALAAAMIEVATDPKRRQAMSEASLRIFESQSVAVSVSGLSAGVKAAMEAKAGLRNKR